MIIRSTDFLKRLDRNEAFYYRNELSYLFDNILNSNQYTKLKLSEMKIA